MAKIAEAVLVPVQEDEEAKRRQRLTRLGLLPTGEEFIGLPLGVKERVARLIKPQDEALISPFPILRQAGGQFLSQFGEALGQPLGEAARRLSEEGQGTAEFLALLAVAGLEATPGGAPLKAGMKSIPRALKRVLPRAKRAAPSFKKLIEVTMPGEKAKLATPELDKVETMWKQKPLKAEGETYRKVQEQLNDQFWGLRRLQRSVSRKGLGVEAGGPQDVAALLTRSPGVANAGATRYLLTVDEMRRVAPEVEDDAINSILFLRHAKEIFAEKGAKRLMAGGIKDIGEADKALGQLEATLGPLKWQQANRATEIVQRIYTEERGRLRQAGFISEEVEQMFAQKYPWYSPLNYLDDLEELQKQGKSARPFTVISSGIKRLTERGTEKAAVRPLFVLGEQLIRNESRIHKNELAKAIVKLAEADGLGVKRVKEVGGEVPGTLSFFEGGERQIYEVPEWIYREAVTLSQVTAHPISSLVGSLNGISRAAFTTFSPPFVVANMLNDSLTAFIHRGILPTETGVTLLRSLRGVANDKIMQSFRLAGGLQARFYGKTAEQLAKSAGLSGGKVLGSGPGLATRMKGAILDSIPSAGAAGEQAPRMALFRKRLNATLPNWRKMSAEEIARTPEARKAAAEAVELTINFGRGGYLIKSANPFIIFLNASFEGAKLPFRALAAQPGARWRLAGVGAGMTSLAAYNLSYPEYFDIPNDVRWGSVVVMLPSKEKDSQGNPKPNYLTIIPRTREWALFVGPLVYAMERMFSENPTDFGTFSRTVAPMLSPISEFPAPEVIAELAEQTANWDFYRSAPVVPTEVEALLPGEQTMPWVSETLRRVGKGVGISPVRLQHAVSGLFGGAGYAATTTTDYILNKLMPPEVNPRVRQMVEIYEAKVEPVERRAFLTQLGSEDRALLEAELRKPEKTIPVLTAMKRRLIPARGGQIRRTGEELGARITGISPKQTRKVSAAIGELSDRSLTRQQELDNAKRDRKISPTEWREARKDMSLEYQGALKVLGVLFPSAAQVQADREKADIYFNTIATLAKAIPDRRTKGQVLLAGLYAIPLEEPVPGSKDWDTFYRMRQEYKDSLSVGDRAILQEELNARMTATEQEYTNLVDNLAQPYFELEEKLIAQLPEKWRKAWENYRTEKDPYMSRKLEQAALIKKIQRMLTEVKRSWRLRNPRVNELLFQWEFVGTPSGDLLK